jgi:hypothetical protein
MGPMQQVMDFLPIDDIVTLQGCNKRTYELMVPRFKPTWPKRKLKKNCFELWYPTTKTLPDTEVRLLMLGLDKSGKTTILY